MLGLLNLRSLSILRFLRFFFAPDRQVMGELYDLQASVYEVLDQYIF